LTCLSHFHGLTSEQLSLCIRDIAIWHFLTFFTFFLGGGFLESSSNYLTF
jgi:hypothetical protein